MKKNSYLKTKVILISVVIIGIMSGYIAKSVGNKKYNNMKNILNDIESKRSNICDDLENKENLYEELISKETNVLKIGEYSSMLVRINTIQGDYNKIKEYGELAIKSYNELPYGDMFVLSEKKHLAWAMYKVNYYPEAFELAYELLNALDSEEFKYLNEEDIKDTKVLIYTIFINIYSEYKLPQEAKIYYDKLCDIEITEELKRTRGDKIAFSKMIYAIEIKDFQLIKKYADECYEVLKEKDKLNKTNAADSIILNCALGNIINGDYETALMQIEKAKEYSKLNNDKTLAIMVENEYARYYRALNNIELSNEYYKKAIELSYEVNDTILLRKIIDEYTGFLNENNMTDNIYENHKIMYELDNINKEKQGFRELLIRSLEYNDEFNNEKLSLKQEEEQLILNRNTVYIFMIIMLISVTSILIYLLKRNKETEKQLEDIANKDYLTKTNTRAKGYKIIEEFIENKQKFSIAILDIDKFKSINDKYGHDIGDLVLQKTASKLIESVEEKDVVIRFGGEEFIIVFAEKNKEQSNNILVNIQKEIKNIKFPNEITVTFSAGLVEYKGKSIDDTIEEVDELLYKAKNNGRDKIEI